MLQLLIDKQTIPFTDGKRINLKLLKNQIDRRILKITALANRMQTERLRCEKGCQANIENLSQPIQRSNLSNKVLGDMNGNDLIAMGKKQGKTKYNQKDAFESYLILAESKFNQTIQPLSQLTRQQAKKLTYHDEDPLKLINSDHSCDNSQLNLDLSNIKFDDNISYQQQAKDLKNYIRNTLSNHKKSNTDRSKVQAFQPTKTQKNPPKKNVEIHEQKFKEASRIIVSYECAQKMQRELNKIANEKRQYQMDYKARANLLKKVEQKFRNYIF